MSPRLRRLWTVLSCLHVFMLPAAAQSIGTVVASGPDVGDTLEDRVEISWSIATPVPSTSSFVIRRNGDLIGLVASTVTLYEDLTAVPGTTYSYCVHVRTAVGSESSPGVCDQGARVINRPTGFTASDGQYEDRVLLSWSDRSEIEAGFNLYRDAGYALDLDGVDDYVAVPGNTVLPASFTVEFWASRRSFNARHYVINLESTSVGDPTTVDLEIGFNALNQFVVGFGANVLASTTAYTDSEWRHFAVTYDAASRRRTLYVDGEPVGTNIYGSAYRPTGALEFGRQTGIGNRNQRGHFNGRVDELRLWNVALTRSEVGSQISRLLPSAQPTLVAHWPMDVKSGLAVPDIVGNLSGVIQNPNLDPIDWSLSGVPDYRTDIAANLTSYSDRSTVPGFDSYTYRLLAYEDVDGDGSYTPGVDYTSEERPDQGWRAQLSPPGDVSATDGQFTDRVRITWVDRSDSENGFSIYRNGGLISSVPADGTLYDDFTATVEQQYTYCVAASNGVESIQVCDDGMRGGLPAPATVAATDGTFDDRVLITWADTSDTESGFEIFRYLFGTSNDSTLVGTTSANAQEFADLSALQEVDYTYCVRAFSLADPENPSYSTPVCAPEKGKREAVLKPENVTATDAEFEDRVEVAWTNPSKTVMLFKVYRSGTLIDVLDYRVTSATDTGILSGTDFNYCVSAETVIAPSTTSLALQGQIAQTLESIRLADVVLLETGGEATSPEVKLSEIYRSVGLDAAGKTGAEAAGDFFESDLVCDPGSRLLAAPTAVNATDDEFETHVQLTWEDNSQIETGYYIYRTPAGGAQALIATLSPNRTTYGDYTGVSGVQYTYAVKAFDDFDASVADDDPGKRTLNPPTALVASDGTSETVVELDWKDNSDAELGFRIYRRVVGALDSVEIGTTGTNEPAFTDTLETADLGADFEYSVVAFDDYGESLPARDEGKSKIEAPTNVYASEGYGDRTIVVWIDRSNVESGYRVTRRAYGAAAGTAFELAPNLAAGTTKYEDHSGVVGIPYEYCVQALFGTGGNASEAVCDVGTKGSLAGGSGGGGGGGATDMEPVRISGPAVGAQFGWSLAWNNAQTLIGAPGATPQGKAYRYSVDALTNMWTQQEAWAPATNGQRFGHAVDIDGSRAIVGDPFALNDNKGGFSIWNQVGSSPWSEQLGFYEPDAGALDNTGYSVAVAGDWTVIGNNQYAATPLPALHGGAIICNPSYTPTKDDGGNIVNLPRCEDSDGYAVPRLEALLATNDRVANAEFGYAVEMVQADDTLLFAFVGAPGDDKAYVFSCNLKVDPLACTSLLNWAKVQEIDTPFRPRGNRFGAAIAADDTFAAIGAPGASGVLWLKRNTTGTWDEVSTLTCAKIKGCDEASSPEFGAALTVHNATILIGAPAEKVANVNAAGAAYLLSLSPSGDPLADPIRYDARAVKGWNPISGARFGAAVSASPDFYLVGAPLDEGAAGQQQAGALYSIPVGTPATKEPPTPVDVTLVAPTNVRASDGSAPDRIQIRWKDESDSEDGHLIFRSREGGVMEELAQVGANIQFYDDFEAAPGEAYTYCVAAFFSNTGQSEAVCDIGWRPANGTIAGRLAAREGGGTDGAQVCLLPSPNKSLVFDGYAGYVETAVGEVLDLERNFTVEAWIRPNAVDNLGYVVFKDSAYALAIENGRLRYDRFTDVGGIDTWEEKALVDTGAPIAAGKWIHVAFTHAEGNNIALFRDGVKLDTLDSTTLASILGDTLTIGASIDIADRTRKNFFRGEMDEVRIWSIAKSASEIANARFDVLRGDEENLVAYWPLDDGRRRIAPDQTEFAGHGRLIDGVYLADEGAPLEICAPTASDGNYSISRIRYGQTAEFNVVPSRAGRAFVPSFKKITLTTESPVQNEVAFTDATAYPIAGFVQYVDVFGDDTFTCPVPNVKIHVDKQNVATDGNLKTTTGADGSYSVAVDPSVDARDTWYVIPQFASLSDAEQVHTFSPSRSEQVVTGPVKNLIFKDLRRHTLSGNFSGGDPDVCGKDIGTAKIRIYTQDGCYDRIITVNSTTNKGAFSEPLPPLKYLVEVVEITGAPQEREAEITEFFKKLGTLEVDLTAGDVERNLIYRAPLVLAIEGLESTCSAGIVQKDEEGTVLRTLPNVPTIGEYAFKDLTIRVREDYGGGGYCNVDEGTVTIFDGIADLADKDSTMALQNGEVKYATFGASANIFSGARIQGIDRSFQKPITVVAQVEGVKPLVETKWALVEGARARSATFVSATTEEFPLLILHDPPGSLSNAFLEKGSTYCSRISKTKLVGGGAGLDLDVKLGVVFETGFSFGAHWANILGIAFNLRNRTIIGRENGSLDGNNIEICLNTTEQFSTSGDPGGVGEDVHIGVALNLIFAIADVLKADTEEANACEVTLTETLAADLDQAKPFETNYVYSKTHIAASLIPELENLIKIAGGDASLTGPIAGTSTTIRLRESLDNWNKQLRNSRQLKAQALANPLINRSFSGNTSFSYAEAVDTTRVTSYEYTRIYVNSAGDAGLWLNFGAEQRISIAFEVNSEWVTEKEETQSTSKAIGYTLNDEDTGDYFSVDVARDPRYGTFVFGTKSGRSSNPWEANTQKRDNPIILVDPPVRYNVDPSSAGSFELTLINGSESNERRLYALGAPAGLNRNNLTLMAGGGYLDGEPYLLDPGKAITVKLDAYPSPSAFSYKRVGVVLYPETERALWTGDVRNPFALADTAFFSVYFDSTGGKVMASVMSEGWTWFSLNREGGDVNRVLRDIPSRHGDMLRSQTAESRYDSTSGWTGSLTTLRPGEGYRIRLQEPSVLRIVGDPVEEFDPIALKPGWSWIGFLPAKGQRLDDALASLEDKVQDGDMVLGQRAFAQYVKGEGWIGTLQEMMPGEGYAIHLAGGGELRYPKSVENPRRPSVSVRERTVRGPEWEIAPERFDASMTMVAEVRLSDVPLEQTTARVAVFAGDSLRGVGDLHYVESLDRHLAFLVIYGGQAGDEEPFRVHVYDGETDKLYEDVGSFRYAAQMMLGNPAQPVVLELTAAGQAPELLEVPETFALRQNYPNPFNPTTTIAYDLPQAAYVQIMVYDVLGRHVSTLVDGDLAAGQHKVVFDAKDLASGFYLYKLKAGDFTQVHKMILVK